MQVVSLIGEIHAHGYLMHQMQGGVPAPNQHLYVASQYRLLADVARRLNKEVWQTEWTFLRHSGHDLDLGLLMARYIVQSINFMVRCCDIVLSVYHSTHHLHGALF